MPTKTFKEGSIKTIAAKSIIPTQSVNASKSTKESAFTGFIVNPKEEMERQEKEHRNSMTEQPQDDEKEQPVI